MEVILETEYVRNLSDKRDRVRLVSRAPYNYATNVRKLEHITKQQHFTPSHSLEKANNGKMHDETASPHQFCILPEPHI